MKDTEDIVCYSQAASTAIHRVTMEDEAVASCSSSAIYLGGRAIDRCNPIIRDASRFGKVMLPQPITTTSKPPSSHDKLPAVNSKPYPNKKYNKQNSNDIHHQKENTIMMSLSSSKKSKSRNDYQKSSGISSADSAEKMIHKTPAPAGHEIVVNSDNNVNISSSAGGGSSSSRYLLSSRRFEPLLSMVEPSPPAICYSPPTSSSSSPVASTSVNQVVVLRVSLHCKGCMRKMKKHISKMEGVKSFDIDFAAKKLTVVGEVTPLSVLASVSKVKKAQLLTTPPLSTFSQNFPISAIRKDKAILV